MASETTNQAEAQASDEASLNALLMQEGAPVETEEAAKTEPDPAATEETEKTEEVPSEEEAAAEIADEDEAAEEDEPEAEEAEEEESELSFEDSDRDYSDEAYQRAAKHYSKTLKVQFDPNDPKDRAALREMMSRGEALKAANAKLATQEKSDDETDDRGAEEQTPKPPTDEQIDAMLNDVESYTATRIVPRVATRLYNGFLKCMWPEEYANGDFKDQQTPERAAEFTKWAMSAVTLAMRDQMPNIYDYVRQATGADPVLGRVARETVVAGAFEMLDAQKDEAGSPKFPGLEAMVSKGVLQKIVKANPEIFDKVFDNDPYKNTAKKLEIAYRMARGESVTPKTVSKAVETGKKQAEKAAAAKAAARLGPGKSKGTFGKAANASEELVDQITSGGGSRFARAVAEQIPRR